MIGYMLLGLIGLVTMLGLSLAAFAGGRYLLARALGITAARFPFHDGPAGSWAGAPRWAAPLLVVVGPFGTYLFAVVLFFASLVIGGVAYREPVVKVIEGRPAAAAGMLSGDRVRTVGGVPTPSWDDLAREIGTHPGTPVTIALERGGEPVSIEVVPSAAGKIGVSAGTDPVMRPIGPGTALMVALSRPLVVSRETIAGFARFGSGAGTEELAGPAAIVRETGKAQESGFGNVLYFLAALASYLLLPFVVMSMLITWRGPAVAGWRRRGPKP
jgi:regulator of sigma E protease